jgi:hypothetical protein
MLASFARTMERAEVEAILEAWHEARERGGDAELEYRDRHPDCVIEFPQSGEVFDRDGLLGMQLEHPGGAPKTKLERLTGHAFKDGKVIRETRYFAEPFQAPEGRAKWTKGGGG